MNGAAEPLASPAPDRRSRHMWEFLTQFSYASRAPVREMAGQCAAPSPYGSFTGSLALEAGTFQSVPLPPLSNEKMISRPLGVQVEPQLSSFKEVRRLGSPLGFKSSVKSNK